MKASIYFIWFVALYDIYLSYKFENVLRDVELNPVGVWLIDIAGGDITFFMCCRFLSILIATTLLYMLSEVRPKLTTFLCSILLLEQIVVLRILLS